MSANQVETTLLDQRNDEKPKNVHFHEQPEDETKERRIRLNVGGTIYETTSSTLTKFPNTLLSTMFSPSNRELLKPDSSGAYFIDRYRLLFLWDF